MKKWIILDSPPQSFFLEHPDLSPIAAKLLWNRGINTQEKIDEFLNPDYTTDLHDPFLFNDMEKAVSLIFKTIENGEKIIVHGDYDADGVCGASIIYKALNKLGSKDTGVFIPHREIDGYGLNMKTVDYLKKEKTSLIITCDCGISSVEEINKCKEIGMMVIVTDHHAAPPVLPKADAIIHPIAPGEKYPDKTLSGGGVAFKLVQALLKKHREKNSTLSDGESHEAFEKWLLDLVAISTVGDMVPLIGESRTLVRYGLTVLSKTRNLGLRELLKTASLLDENGKPKRSFDTETISFQIAPRVNAAGRMDHANVAFALLTAESKETSEELAKKLQKNNSDRQKLTDQLVTAAREQIKASDQEKNPILFVVGEGWSTGILGLIASRIKEEFFKPTLVMGLNNNTITGSGRSVPGFNMIKALQSIPEFFQKFGGHPQACGFSLKSPEDLPKFKEKMTDFATESTEGIELIPQIKIDSIVSLEDINWKLYDLLQKFEPFGMNNEEPVYGAIGLTVMGVEPVGKDNKHLRLMVKHNSHVVRKTIAFGFGDPVKHPSNWGEALKPGDKIDLAFNVGVNEWNGNRELQLMVSDIRKNVLTTENILTDKPDLQEVF